MTEPQYTTTTIKPLACEREMYTNTFQNEDGEWVVELETNIQNTVIGVKSKAGL